MKTILLLILVFGAAAEAAVFKFARPRTFRVETAGDPAEIYLALTRFLYRRGMADQSNYLSRDGRPWPESAIFLHVSAENEASLFAWCAEHQCRLTVTYAAEGSEVYRDPKVIRAFADINARLRRLARDLLTHPDPQALVAAETAALEALFRPLPSEGGTVNVSHELSSLKASAAALTPPDLTNLATIPLPRGPIRPAVQIDDSLQRVADKMNRFTHEDWARVVEEWPQYRNIVRGYQEELAHQQASSEDTLWLEGRLNFLDRVVFLGLTPPDERGMNPDSYEVAAETFLRLLDALEQARREQRVFPFEILDVLNRYLTLSDRWVRRLPDPGPRLVHLCQRLAGMEGLNPYFRLLFRAAYDGPSLPADDSLYEELPGAVASQPVRNVADLEIPTLPFGKLRNTVAGPTDYAIHQGVAFIDRWRERHGLWTHDWTRTPRVSLEIHRSRLADVRRANLRSLGLDDCDSDLTRLLNSRK